jgi:hypothetical protein
MKTRYDMLGNKNCWVKPFLSCVVSFFVALILAIGLLTLVFSIPNDRILENASRSVEQVNADWDSLKTMGSNLTPQMWLRSGVNYDTERKWMLRSVVEDTSLTPLQAAMSINGYARYWHGYLVAIRPLLLVTDYHGIVLINAILFILMLSTVMWRMWRKTGPLSAMLFMLALVVARISSLVICLNFTGSFLAAMFLILLVDQLAGSEREWLLYPLFLVTGMLTVFVDVLMTPIVSLGLPLLYLMKIHLKQPAYSLKKCLPQAVLLSGAWGIGYGAFWASKWIIGSKVLGWNVLTDALDTAEFRISGNATDVASPIRSLGLNFGQLFYHHSELFILTALVVLAMALLLHRPWKEWLRALPLLLVSLYPVLWICVLANHSEVHYYFTFRILTVLLFGVGIYLLHCCDFQKIARYFQKSSKE